MNINDYQPNYFINFKIKLVFLMKLKKKINEKSLKLIEKQKLQGKNV